MDEFGVVDHVKSFGKISSPSQCVEWGTSLIKALCYFMWKRLYGRYDGVAVTKAMLVG